ncbi:hypothetical protein CYMTET_12487 [Cymbomonas tetramitiformis]|uniref:Uncharacterized protein n=1 Tax=Cymbomonas tetramitiformis TaxID=36881 RepID=A0AAE0GK03_9CHLO|nr:hypothetical protein CYMTET_12487 [Cymbomonas tetramitiformis]
MITESRESRDEVGAKLLINRAGELVQEILQRANQEAIRSELLPTVLVNASRKQDNNLHLSGKTRKKRDKEIGNMLSMKKTKKELKDEVRTRETLEALRKGGQQGPSNKQTATPEEWAAWLTQEANKYRAEARQCVQEHEQERKQKRTNRIVREYWSNQKQYHKKIYQAAQTNGHAPTRQEYKH